MLDSVSQEVSDGLEHCTAVHKHLMLIFIIVLWVIVSLLTTKLFLTYLKIRGLSITLSKSTKALSCLPSTVL